MFIQANDILRNRYRIIQLIGRGGMADVYLALDMRRQARVAIKVLREDLAEDPDFVRRFAREARTLAQLDHPNIVRFYSFEQEGLIAFMVMDYVDGVTLRRLVAERKGPLRVDEITAILRQVGAALHYAHASGIIHRDLKPGNIMIQRDGKALLTDFGIAKIVESSTLTTISAGTPAYMSPEQILNRPLDHRTDIYSLGVVLYLLATGRRPFSGDEPGLTGTGTMARVREAHLRVPPPDPRTLNSNLPAEASQVIIKALAKRPDDRWQDVMSLVSAWERAVGADPTQRMTAPTIISPPPVSASPHRGPSHSVPPPPPPDVRARQNVPGQPPRKNSVAPVLIAMGAIVVVLLLAWLLMSKHGRGDARTSVANLPPTPTTQIIRETSTPQPENTADVESTAQALAATYAAATKEFEATVKARVDESSHKTMTVVAATATTGALSQAATATALAHGAMMRTATAQAQGQAATATAQALQATRTAQAEATQIAAATATANAGPPSCAIPVGGSFRSRWNARDVYSRLGCPTGGAHQSMAAEERFERGIMLWRDTTDSVYVLYDDGTWAQYQDHFINGQDPEFTCGAPQSPPTPKRGFGKVWCLHPEVRNKLGNAVEEEVGFGMPGGGPAEIFQDFQGGMMYQSNHFNTIFVLFNDNTWRR